MTTSIDLHMNGVSSQVGLQMSDMLGELSDVEAVKRSNTSGDRFGPVEVAFVLSVVLSGGLSLQFLAEATYKIRQRFRPLVILDFSADEPKVHVIDGVPGMRGEVVIRTRDGEDVRIDGPDSESAIVSGIQKVLGHEA